MGRRKTSYKSALAPDVRTLAKLGSIVAHVNEWHGSGGHPFDMDAAKALLADPDVQQWLDDMNKLALIPKARTLPTTANTDEGKQ